ncbi:PAS/PAC sensor signal transduction histidine kinase [Tenacibaculum skagerrakense]|uniref:histidine kinase n=1 Tax=Tenacibaculum skagerrakense TaxID=186571 RepID=A0A4R2NT49_9FLAO|nr:PAS domain-containing sensor histidine kinase [Tenacibaculum skagerrakense]TCP25189.1 PAS/PAC sensor signal transduction histidine kinase [Tenacibaculum skagerrakense]
MFSKEDKVVFDTLFEAVSEAVVVVDEFQKITVINSSAEQMFGYKKEELLNEHLEILIPQKYKQHHGTHFKSFLGTKEKRQMGTGRDLYAVHKEGNVFPIEVGLNPLEIQGEKYIMALVVDISLRKHQELEILELNTKLENKVKERTRNLKTTVEELEKINIELDKENKRRIEAEQKAKVALKKERELNELKTKFLSLVSHEFKTPLSGILTSSMLLAKYKLTEQQDKREKHLSVINNKVHYLNNILNDFLSIEKLEKGEVNYNLSSFSVKGAIEKTIENLGLLRKSGQIIVVESTADEALIYHDEKIMELTLSNLVSNAIKYSPENATITITLAQNEQETLIQVIDNGFGIPEKDQKNIFQRYFRAENVLLNQGTGIGLNIVKSHLENLGGTITFVSEENKGSAFSIKLPNKARV